MDLGLIFPANSSNNAVLPIALELSMWQDCNCGRRNTEIDPCPTCGAGVAFPGEEIDRDLAEIDPTAAGLFGIVRHLPRDPSSPAPFWGGTELVFDEED